MTRRQATLEMITSCPFPISLVPDNHVFTHEYPPPVGGSLGNGGVFALVTFHPMFLHSVSPQPSPAHVL